MPKHRNAPARVGYPAVINVMKAASPLALAASNAASIRPPNPRSISATAIVIFFVSNSLLGLLLISDKFPNLSAVKVGDWCAEENVVQVIQVVSNQRRLNVLIFANTIDGDECEFRSVVVNRNRNPMPEKIGTRSVLRTERIVIGRSTWNYERFDGQTYVEVEVLITQRMCSHHLKVVRHSPDGD